MAYLISLALIAIAGALGAYFYPTLPTEMAVHWNAAGVSDGYASKLQGVLFMPILMLALLALLALIPRIDPLRRNIQLFKREYETFVVMLMLFMTAVQTAILLANHGLDFNILYIIMPAIGALFFAIGRMLPRTKRNWFVGIRTPWTVSSDEVWRKTHEAGGWVFEILGALAALSAFVPSYAIFVFIVPLSLSVIGLVVYSYILYGQAVEGRLS